jgi:hypothetical protein
MIKSNQLMPITQTNEVGEVIHLAKSGRLIVKLNAVGAERIITMTDRTSRLVGSKVFGGGFAKKHHDQSRSFSRPRRDR